MTGRRGRVRTLLETRYRRLGARYPLAAVTGQLRLVYLLVIGGIWGLSSYVEMSVGELVRIMLVGCGLMFVYNVICARIAAGLLRPVVSWLDGERDAAATRSAWRACASFPREMLRRGLSIWSPAGAFTYLGFSAWAGYVTWELELPAYSLPLLAAGIAFFATYTVCLRFLITELVLRPVLEDLAGSLLDEVELAAPGVSLRFRLLAALPAINVITGAIASAVAGARDGLGDLALAVGVSAAVAATLSLALTVLLANSVTGPISVLRDATERIRRGDLATRVPVVTTDETGTLASSFNQMSAGLQQRERLREAFGTFVDPYLTERVLREGTDLAGEEVDLSLLFMDVRGFTRYSERAEARAVVARLNDLYGVVVPAILRHDGHANKFIGDGLLAVFGAPNRLPEHADRAVAAGLEIARLVRDRYHGELRVGIGINTGQVIVGTIGGGGRLDFTVIGDAVNIAARVESATRQTDDDLLITDATRRALSTDTDGWEERPPVALKGKTQQVRLYAPRTTQQAAPAG